MHGFELMKQGSIYRVSRVPQQRSQLELNVTEDDLPTDADSPSDVRLTLLAKNAQAGEVANLLSEKLGVSIVLDGPLQGSITANLQDVSVEEALQGVFGSSQFLLKKRGSVYHLTNRSPQTCGQRGRQMLFFSEGKLTAELVSAPLEDVLTDLAEQADINLVMVGSAGRSRASMESTLTLKLTDIPLDEALGYLTSSVGLSYRKQEGSHRQQGQYQGDGQHQAGYQEPVHSQQKSVSYQRGVSQQRAVSQGRAVYLIGDTSLQPGVENPLLDQQVFWLNYLDAAEAVNLLPRDIPNANISVDPTRNALIAVASPHILQRLEGVLTELDVEDDTIRSRLPGALSVTVTETGRLTLDVKGAPLETILREVAIRADVDITLLPSLGMGQLRASQTSQSSQTTRAAPALRSASTTGEGIHLRLQDAELNEVLDALLVGTGYAYRETQRGREIQRGDETAQESGTERDMAAEQDMEIGQDAGTGQRRHYLIAPGELTLAGRNPLLITRRVPFRYLHASDAESLEQKLFLMLPVTIPRESITVLPDQNAVTVMGTPETVDAILSYLELIDVPTSQVMIEVMLVEVRQGDSESLGLSLLGESSRLALESSAGIGLHFDTLAKIPEAFQASLEALVSRNRARVLASPRVAVLHGEQATIRVGMENLFETVTEVYRGEDVVVGGVTRQSFNSIQTGITLTLRPWIGSAGDITLQIQPQVRDGSNISREASTIVERSVDTQVRVSDGGMVVIGGLLQEREERTESGVPVLSRVPLLGALFRESSTQSHQTELLVLIHPELSESSRQNEGSRLSENGSSVGSSSPDGSGADSPGPASPPTDSGSINSEDEGRQK